MHRKGEGNPAWGKRADGTGISGNLRGHPGAPERRMLRDALQRAKAKNGGVDLIEHCVAKSYTDTQLAIAILRKILPDLSNDESMRDVVRTFLVRAEPPPADVVPVSGSDPERKAQELKIL